jgi:hypothetical protein
MLRPGGPLINIFTATVDGDIERDRNEAERRGYHKITTVIDFERAGDSMREITRLIDGGLVHIPPIDVLPLEDAARAHRIIETGHVRGKLLLKVQPNNVWVQIATLVKDVVHAGTLRSCIRTRFTAMAPNSTPKKLQHKVFGRTSFSTPLAAFVHGSYKVALVATLKC